MSKVFRNSDSAAVSFSENAFDPAYMPEHASGDDPTSEKFQYLNALKTYLHLHRQYTEELVIKTRI